MDESSISRASQEDERAFSSSGDREEGQVEMLEEEGEGMVEAYAQRTAVEGRRVDAEESRVRGREYERDVTHMRARMAAAASPVLPTPEVRQSPVIYSIHRDR
jgi:hypothetical protein